jgi:hypothetical protein
MNPVVHYVAQLSHVREVSLLGTADLAFWQDRLKNENLLPVERDGQAQLLIVAADMRFKGVRFRELSFSILVAQDEQGMRRDGAYLAQAFNSCRLFAFCERVFFSTPYYPGDVRVATSYPSSIQLLKGGEVVFRAEMQADISSPKRKPSRSEEDCWEGPIFLPGKGRGKDGQGKWFFARLRGHTQTYPFLHSLDAVTIKPSRGGDVLQALLDSHFAGKEWAVREDATHAKSKTYKRAEVFADSART